MRLSGLVSAGAASLMLVGCGALPVSAVPEHELRSETDDARIRLVLTVARARASLDLVDGRMNWHGVYGGESAGGCARVRLNQEEASEHHGHYLACGNRVLEIAGVAPEPDRDTRVVAVLKSLTRAAWRTGGIQRAPFEGYELEAEPVGPAFFGVCRIVEQRLLYQDMVVDVREERVCG